MKTDRFDKLYKRVFIRTAKAVYEIAWIIQESSNSIRIAFFNAKRNHSENTPCVFAFPPMGDFDYETIDRAMITEMRYRE
jgi:hypothetical protein